MSLGKSTNAKMNTTYNGVVSNDKMQQYVYERVNIKAYASVRMEITVHDAPLHVHVQEQPLFVGQLYALIVLHHED